jgi:alkylation response protein AidB-like acyl-CoA dehydrogenase
MEIARTEDERADQQALRRFCERKVAPHGGGGPRREVALGGLPRAGQRATLEAIQVFGGYGYMEESEVERALRDAKLLEIGAGTTEVQLLVIAKSRMGDAAR